MKIDNRIAIFVAVSFACSIFSYVPSSIAWSNCCSTVCSKEHTLGSFSYRSCMVECAKNQMPEANCETSNLVYQERDPDFSCPQYSLGNIGSLGRCSCSPVLNDNVACEIFVNCRDGSIQRAVVRGQLTKNGWNESFFDGTETQRYSSAEDLIMKSCAAVRGRTR